MTYSPHLVVGSELIAPTLAVILMGIFCYFVGRLHQYCRRAQDRDAAFQHGYDTATKSLFALATRVSRTVEQQPELLRETRRPRPKPLPMRASARVGPKHAAAGKSTLQETKQFTPWELAKKKSA